MTKELGPVFRWRTMDGQVLTLDQMDTKHLFNSMKMVFNHLAAQHGGRPVWFQQQYGDYHEACREHPQTQAALVVMFLKEIDRRGDLPEKYAQPFAEIKEQIVPLQKRLPPAPTDGRKIRVKQQHFVRFFSPGTFVAESPTWNATATSVSSPTIILGGGRNRCAPRMSSSIGNRRKPAKESK